MMSVGSVLADPPHPSKKCLYTFAKDSAVALVNQYTIADSKIFSNRLIHKLEEVAGYTLLPESSEQTQAEYSFSYSIEADGAVRKINPALTLIYRTSDETKTRVIMKSKRVRHEKDRVIAIERLIDSAVKQVPKCPTWKP